MSELNVIQECNQCGECCRHGGKCVLRGPAWTGWYTRTLPLIFQGTCELLSPQSKCRVMEHTHPFLLREAGIIGKCDFPDLRLDNPPPVC